MNIHIDVNGISMYLYVDMCTDAQTHRHTHTCTYTNISYIYFLVAN